MRREIILIHLYIMGCFSSVNMCKTYLYLTFDDPVMFFFVVNLFIVYIFLVTVPCKLNQFTELQKNLTYKGTLLMKNIIEYFSIFTV